MVEVHFKNDKESMWIASFNSEETCKELFDKIQDMRKESKFHTIMIIYETGSVELKWSSNGRRENL
jgi:hypothetical protein